jgi:hypothetical protein
MWEELETPADEKITDEQASVTPEPTPEAREKRAHSKRVEMLNSTRPALRAGDSWIEKILHPRGKTGIFVTISVAIVFVLLINTSAYYYLLDQPPDTSAYYCFRYFRGIQTWDTGTGTLLLGDSSCMANLDNGAFADRLGGTAVNLGTTAQTSVLMDAWLLSTYIERFGAPRNVIVCRSASAYGASHTVEYMAAPPLPWDYWDELGVAPAWKRGEVKDLFVARYAVLYSYSDILKDRLVGVRSLFSNHVNPTPISKVYSRGSTSPQEQMDISKKLPDYYFRIFSASSDTTIAFRYMSDLAREKHFQLYILFQPEWDEAIDSGLREPILDAQISYLSSFVDPTYVHIVRDESLAFSINQMQNPNHLRPGADHIKTESDISGIVSIQNQLTDDRAVSLDLDSVSTDKASYKAGDMPIVEISFSTEDIVSPGDLTGSVSCLIKPSGKSDGYWVSRASSVAYKVGADGRVALDLQLNVGKIEGAGTYDLVVFLQQDVGNLSHETRYEIPYGIIVK